MISLDVDSVRAFVVISDLKSFTRAAEELGTTQGALSVKLKRLEDRLGQRLVERTPRHVRLSSPGELFIESARNFLEAHERAITSLAATRRQFKLGIACYVMGPEVPKILSRLKSLDPSFLIEVKLDSSRVLLDDFSNGLLDAVIIRSDDARRDGTVLCPEHFGWFAAPDFEYRSDEPLRLASLTPDCGVRDLAAKALKQASIRWTEVFVGGGLSVVIAAISAGLAIGAFSRRLASPELVEVGPKFGLPVLPSFSIVLHSSLSDKRTRGALRAIASAFREV
ncbi:LysR family transcriptional regulator [Sodalis sp. RH22]|uniref:LysR family transcriptional regulator n=1 Tax=unclassified Sodalis (in: enterobacteria) TaxID=2636512 RepID=UPI0039B54C61